MYHLAKQYPCLSHHANVTGGSCSGPNTLECMGDEGTLLLESSHPGMTFERVSDGVLGMLWEHTPLICLAQAHFVSPLNPYELGLFDKANLNPGSSQSKLKHQYFLGIPIHICTGIPEPCLM